MELLQQFQKNTGDVSEQMHSFSVADFNTRPSPGQWSAAEVLEHLYRSEFGIPKLFGTNTMTVDRSGDAKLSQMKKNLLDLGAKAKAPKTIQPTNKSKEKTELLAKFTSNRDKIALVFSESDPHELCLLYAHPIFGKLTRLEWMNFCILHAQRHIHQLKAIQKAL